jgi:hypothetical protein
VVTTLREVCGHMMVDIVSLVAGGRSNVRYGRSCRRGRWT